MMGLRDSSVVTDWSFRRNIHGHCNFSRRGMLTNYVGNGFAELYLSPILEKSA